MHNLTSKLVLVFSLLLASACVLVDQPTGDSSYEHAYFSVSAEPQVADGLTPVRLLVHGDFSSTLTVQVSNANFFGGGSAESQNEKTVQLLETDENGQGFAELQIVSMQPGISQVSFKLAPLAAVAEIEFAPVELLLQEPVAVDFRPGEVVHHVCVFANTSRGALLASAKSGAITPGRSELQASAISACQAPSSSWIGAALLLWDSAESESEIEIDYLGAQDQKLLHYEGQLQGQAFPGYRAQLEDVEATSQWARVQTQLFYEASNTLAERTASSVPLHGLRSVPPGLTLVGSSSGNGGAVPETDTQGSVTLYFEIPPGQAPWSVFATPQGGGTTYLGEVIPLTLPDN